MIKTIKIFFGYQFLGAKISRIDRESAYSVILENVNKELGHSEHIELTWDYWELKTNDYIGEQILNFLDSSDILVFDLSEANVNVFIELGYAIALSRNGNKKIILIVHEDIELDAFGSDLSGKYILKVNDRNIIPQLGKKIKDAVKDFLKLTKSEIVYNFWGLEKYKRITIVCPEIPTLLRTKFANPEESNYLRYSKFADIDALVYIKVHLKSLNKKLLVTDITSEEYHQSHDECQIIVGGPAWNRVSKEYQKLLPAIFENGGDGFDDPLVIRHNESIIKLLPHEKNSSLISDVSLFARLEYGLKKRVYLISGCRTLGVLGSAVAFFSEDFAPNNMEYIYSKVGDRDFVVVFRTKPICGTISSVDLNDGSVAALFALNNIENNFERII